MVKVEIYNGSERQLWIDATGKNKHEKIYPIGIKENVILEIEESEIKRIINELPKGALINVLK